MCKTRPRGASYHRLEAGEPFMTGFIQDDKYVGRPVDIEWLKDESMLRHLRAAAAGEHAALGGKMARIGRTASLLAVLLAGALPAFAAERSPTTITARCTTYPDPGRAVGQHGRDRLGANRVS